MTPPLAQTTTLLAERITDALPGAALGSARLLPIVLLAPTFGGRLLPAPLRVGTALGLALLTAPPTPPSVDAAWAVALAREVAVGSCLGLLAALPFALAQSAGGLVDGIRGARLASLLVPGTREGASPTGNTLHLLLLAAVTGAGGDRWVLTGLARSFAALPPGAPWQGGATGAAAEVLLTASADLLTAAACIAAPAVVACLLGDLALGIVGRVAPELPLFFLGLPVKSAGVLCLLALGMGEVVRRLVDAFATQGPSWEALLRSLGGAG